MGLLTLVEDRPTPKEVYNWRVYFCAAVASFASCMIGYDSAFIGTTLALPSFVSEFGFAKMQPTHLALVKSNIVSVYQGESRPAYSCGAPMLRVSMLTRPLPSWRVLRQSNCLHLSLLPRPSQEFVVLRHDIPDWCWHHAGVKPWQSCTHSCRACLGWHWCWRIVHDCAHLYFRIVTTCYSWSSRWYL